MTVRMQIVMTDDLIEFETKGKQLTDIGDDGETALISLNGHARELHLTAKNAAALRDDMRRWLAAGHEPGQQPLPPGQPPQEPRRQGQGRRREIPGTRDFYRGLRDWAADQGREVPMAGRSDAKRNYVYKDLLGPYLTWLEREAKDGKDGGMAAIQLAIAARLELITAVP